MPLILRHLAYESTVIAKILKPSSVQGSESVQPRHSKGRRTTVRRFLGPLPERRQIPATIARECSTALVAQARIGPIAAEIGHYYWDRLVAGTPWHEKFRELFGDERQDYAAALKR